MKIFIIKLYRLLLAPVSSDVDARRRELITNILLLASVVLCALAFCINFFQKLYYGDQYLGTTPWITGLILLFFLALYLTSKRGSSTVPALILIAIYYLVATYSVMRWGIVIPEGLLVYALVITLSGILGSPRLAVSTTIIVILTLFALVALQLQGWFHPDLSWQRERVDYATTLVYAITFLILFFVSWLSKREIDDALVRARSSEQALLHQRDQLEVLVEERTLELKHSQEVELTQMYEMVELGRLSSGLLHDLLTPLATVSLTLAQLPTQDSTLVERAIRNTKRIEHFVQVARNQISQPREQINFRLSEEITAVLDLLADRLLKIGLEVQVSGDVRLMISGDPMKFQRLVSNLLTNAIDAYSPGKPKKPIEVQFCAISGGIQLIIQDFGMGISSEQMGHIFEPFFTTKSTGNGTGIGLGICREIVERDFRGQLHLTSKPGIGTRAEVLIRTNHD